MIRNGIRRAFRLALHRRDRWERDVEDEIKLHLTLRAEQLVERGIAPADAYDEAVRRFGPLAESRARLIDTARHREHSMQRTEYLADMRQDLAFAFRTLRRDAGWTAVTVLTLALGIGATTAVFSVVSNLLLHAVAYPHADRVVILYQQPAAGNNTGLSVTILPSMPVIRAWRTAHSLEALEALQSGQVQLETTGEPASVQATRIEASFPAFGGVTPMIGRMFTAEEAGSGAHDAVLGEGLWRTRFGADRNVLGKVITLGIGKADSTFTVIGVLPAKLQAPSGAARTTDIWLPINLENDSSGARIVARLAAGINGRRAEQELDSISSHLENGKSQFRSIAMSPSQFVPFRDSLVMLAGAVALVLLVACANVAHLLMARSANRRRELAIRVALGAGRGRVFRQLLTESVVIAASGGVLGVLVGMLGLKAIIALRPPSLTQLTTVHVDMTTLELALVVTLVTSIAFGLLGAWSAARQSTSDVLKTGGARSATGRWRGRQLLVVTEMALSATLVVGASMLVQSVINLQHADLGFEANGLYAVTVDWPASWAKLAGQGATYRALDSRLAHIPGVQSVALASNPPSWYSFSIGRLEVDGEPNAAAPATSFVTVNS
ncbi:MAG TPA: ABC transporter permease, partial [Gemmatimonadaceae bacterium]|nr:ABC transporter permease [Gemmatimonadaceae bacterium]